MAGIVISILVVGAVVVFFIMKRRSRRSSTDVEKLDNQPFTPLASHEVQGTHSPYVNLYWKFTPISLAPFLAVGDIKLLLGKLI